MDLGKMPLALRLLNQWVCASADSKMPFVADCDHPASATDKTTWCSYEVAKESVEAGYYDYIGFVFADNGLVAIDIDTGFDSQGNTTPLAEDIISKCASYTEKSRSGRGFHIIVKGELPFSGSNNREGVEIYKTGRYFIMTGDVYKYERITANQAAIDFVVSEYFNEVRESKDNPVFKTKYYTPVWERGNTGKIKITPKYPDIAEGGRNLSLLSFGCSLLSQGYDDGQIAYKMAKVNRECCKPPLATSEVDAIYKSVLKYKRKLG